MKYEWDPEKSLLNRDKHGVSFEEAEAIWRTPHVDVAHIARSIAGENRNATVGRIGGDIYVAIWTKRGEKILLISVRRARKHEEEILYESVRDDG